MTEISKVFKGVSFTDSLENYIDSKNISLCQFLFFLDIADIAQYIEHHFYGDKDWHFRYDVEAMIRFMVVKFFRQ
jgi:phosphate starvation-inducible membrane PsiE